MRLNQKRALFSAIAPVTIFLVLGIWYVALEGTARTLFTTPEVYNTPPAVRAWLDGTSFAIGFFGTISIPLGIIAALVFWWLDRQETKS